MRSRDDSAGRLRRVTAVILSCALLLCGCGAHKQKMSESDNVRTYYEVFVYSFCDSDGDGIGDLAGLDSKLDYISDMGFTGIWLMPVCSAMSYHKYDTTDYESIDRQYGTMADYEKLIKDCHARGIKVINDLVINHTGSEHPWFIRAAEYLKENPGVTIEKAEEECPETGYYNFVSESRAGYQKLDNTSWYYEARFSKKMPDLNLDNETVRSSIRDIMKFWIDKGTDGFRLDAAKDYYTGNTDRNTEMLSFLQKTAKALDPDVYMVAELWDSYDKIIKYYRSGITSIFNYPFGNSDGQIVKTLRGAGNSGRVSKYAENLEKAEKAYSSSNPSFIDAPFLSNHDTGRIEGFMSGDEDKVKLAGAMNLFMSGTAFVYYGEELGMSGSGNDPSKRAPMYWSGTDKTGMTLPPPGCASCDNPFGAYDTQKNDSRSVCSYYKEAIRIRNAEPAISHGATACEDALNRDCISAVRKSYGGNSCIILMNISDKDAAADLSSYSGWKVKYSLSVSENEPSLCGDVLSVPAYGVAVLAD